MFDTQVHFPDEIANQIQANIQECGETFEQFVQQAVEHELQQRKIKQSKQPNDLKRINSFIDKHEALLLKLAK